jgi:hypothetical protein
MAWMRCVEPPETVLSGRPRIRIGVDKEGERSAS